MGNPSIFFRDDVDPANELNMEERCGLGWGILGRRSEMDGPETSRDKFLLHLLHMYVHMYKYSPVRMCSTSGEIWSHYPSGTL